MSNTLAKIIKFIISILLIVVAFRLALGVINVLFKVAIIIIALALIFGIFKIPFGESGNNRY